MTIERIKKLLLGNDEDMMIGLEFLEIYSDPSSIFTTGGHKRGWEYMFFDRGKIADIGVIIVWGPKNTYWINSECIFLAENAERRREWMQMTHGCTHTKLSTYDNNKPEDQETS